MSTRDELKDVAEDAWKSAVDKYWKSQKTCTLGQSERVAREAFQVGMSAAVDAILARYAVAERPDLPIPTEDGSAPGMKLWYLAGITVSAGRGEVWTRQSFRNRGPGGARALASVLIEAADHAEVTDVDR